MSDRFQIMCPQCSSRLTLKLTRTVTADKRITCPQCEATFILGDELAEAANASLAGLGAEDSRKSDPASDHRRSPTDSSRRGRSSSASSGTSSAAASGFESLRPGTERSDPPRSSRPGARSAASSAKGRTSPNRVSKSVNPQDDDGLEYFDDEEDAGNPWAEMPEERGDFKPVTAPDRSGRASSRRPPQHQESSAELSTLRRMGVAGWLLFGFLGGAVGFGLSLASGWTGNDWIISVPAAFAGILTGLGVRFGAGTSVGVGPGLVAASIALLCMFAGKVAAYAVMGDAPDEAAAGEIQPEAAAEDGSGDPKSVQEAFDETFDEIAQQATTDEGMTAYYAEQIQEQGIDSGRITQAQMDEHFEQLDAQEDVSDPSAHYLPEVWKEAEAQWSALPEQQRQAEVNDLLQDWSEGEPPTPELRKDAEASALSSHADRVEEEWIAGGKATQEQVEAHRNAVYNQQEAEDQKAAYLPEVWAEASSRWNALNDEQKAAEKDKVRTELRTAQENLERIGNAISANLPLIKAVLRALLNCFWPFTGPLFFWTGLVAAWRLASTPLAAG